MASDDAPRFYSLKAFQRADDLAVAVFPVSRQLRSVDLSLASQVFRAAYSAPSNIAEGYGRASKKEFAQFLGIAHGSVYELEYFLHLLRRLDLLDLPTADKLTSQCREVARLVYGLMRSTRLDARGDPGRRYLKEERASYAYDLQSDDV